jgi:hypothetical protein
VGDWVRVLVLLEKIAGRLHMKDHIEERYVFYRLSLVDMDSALRSLSYLPSAADSHIKRILIRDAAVSYMRPFSDNKGIYQESGLVVPESLVPGALREAHRNVKKYRDKLFAHMDLDYQNPHLESFVIDGQKHFPFTVRGYEGYELGDLAESLERLADTVKKILHKEIKDIEEKHL